MPSERRGIILARAGRHVTMGRAAPPSEAEVEAAAAALAAQGLVGWLATLDGNYWVAPPRGPGTAANTGRRRRARLADRHTAFEVTQQLQSTCGADCYSDNRCGALSGWMNR